MAALALGVGALVGSALAAPDSAAAESLSVSVAVTADGAKPFDQADEGPGNGKVRPGDPVTYGLTVDPGAKPAHDVVLRVSAAEPKWAAGAVEVDCGEAGEPVSEGAGCALGEVSEPVTVPATLSVPEDAEPGAAITVSAVVEAAETDEPVPSEPAVTKVVAAEDPTPTPTETTQDPTPSDSPTGGSGDSGDPGGPDGPGGPGGPGGSDGPGGSGGSGGSDGPGGSDGSDPGGAGGFGPGGSGGSGGSDSAASGGSGSGGGSGEASFPGRRPPDGLDSGFGRTATPPGSTRLPSVARSSTAPGPLVATFPSDSPTGATEHDARAAGAVTPTLRATPFVAAAVFILGLALTRHLLVRRIRRRRS